MPARHVRKLALSSIGLGTAPLGGLFSAVSDEDAAEVLTAAWNAGVRYFDTAPHYGVGLAERRLGGFLLDCPRSDFIVSTKVGRLLVPGLGKDGDDAYWGGAPGLVRNRDYSRAGVRRSVEESLLRTGLDRFDLVLIHDPDDYWDDAIRFAYPELERMRKEGTVSAIGVGMNQWQMLLRFVENSDIDVVLIAGRYTLLDRTAEAELLPACLERGVAVIAGGTLNSGVLAEPSPSAHFDYEPVSEELLRRVREIEQRCQLFGVPLIAAAIQFPLRHPAITTALIGARSSREIKADLTFADLPIPDALWDAVEDMALSSAD